MHEPLSVSPDEPRCAKRRPSAPPIKQRRYSQAGPAARLPASHLEAALQSQQDRPESPRDRRRTLRPGGRAGRRPTGGGSLAGDERLGGTPVPLWLPLRSPLRRNIIRAPLPASAVCVPPALRPGWLRSCLARRASDWEGVLPRGGRLASQPSSRRGIASLNAGGSDSAALGTAAAGRALGLDRERSRRVRAGPALFTTEPLKVNRESGGAQVHITEIGKVFCAKGKTLLLVFRHWSLAFKFRRQTNVSLHSDLARFPFGNGRNHANLARFGAGYCFT